MKNTLTILGIVVTAFLLAIGSINAQDETIVDIAVGNEDFSTLVTAVQAAGLADVLADPDASWTVFAPTNDAFAALPEGLLDTLLADTELLTRVLTYHVVEGIVTSDQLTDMMAPSMEMTAPGADLIGSELEVTIADDGTVMINDATVIQADILASNGVIHVIDRVLVPPEIAMMMNDMNDMMEATVYVSLNPAELADDSIVMLSDMMEAMTVFDEFDGISSIQSVKFASDGSAYVTVDVSENEGAILILDSMGMATGMIGGTESAGLVSPKGLEIIEDLDLVLVANLGPVNIKGFSLDAQGDVAPTVFIDDLGGVTGSIWDIHYAEEIDTLFVAGTTGTLLAYADFSNDLGASGPTRLIVPSDADGNQISVNIHGVDYDPASDTLLLTDVGAADDNSDGQIFTISSASEANGNVTVDLAIAGPESMLGNPVDVVFDGSGIYVAEKANDAVLYYADIVDMMGMMDSTATEIIEISKPESVTIVHTMGDM